jgi:hypothetical protein
MSNTGQQMFKRMRNFCVAVERAYVAILFVYDLTLENIEGPTWSSLTHTLCTVIVCSV